MTIRSGIRKTSFPRHKSFFTEEELKRDIADLQDIKKYRCPLCHFVYFREKFEPCPKCDHGSMAIVD